MTALTNPLDAVKIEQRLKYLGYGAFNDGKTVQKTEIAVDGKISEQEAAVMRLFREVTENRSDYLKRTVSGRNGKSETTTIAPYTVSLSSADLNWLNAYNAPHWMTFAGALKGQLTGWTNKSGKAGEVTYLSSWVSDLMLAAQQNNQGREKLWFKGAGTLGNRLDLGINIQYISTDNQARVHGKDKVLGVVPDKADSSIPNQGAYGTWNLANANALAGKLLNPTVDPQTTGNPANAQGANQQNEALRDFLAVYAVTQKEGNDPKNPNGFWEKIDLKYATGGYKTGLFGDGSLIKSNGVLLGGTATSLGSALSAKSLVSYMQSAVRKDRTVNYSDWIEPLQWGMAIFGINTPARISAFLAQVKTESAGLSILAEELLYWDTGTPTIAQLLSEGPANSILAIPWRAWLMRPGKTLDAYNDPGRSERENIKKWFREVIVAGVYGVDLNNLTPAVLATKVPWINGGKQALANRVYSSDKGNPSGTGVDANGPETSGDGYRYIGYGIKQLTGKSNVSLFADWVGNNGNRLSLSAADAANLRNQIIANPSLLESNKQLAVLSGAHFWSINQSKSPSSGVSTGRLLSAEADRLNWSSPTPASDEQAFNQISRGIATAAGSFPNRWDNYKLIANSAQKGGNPHENMVASLQRLGMSSKSATGYESKFGLSLNTRSVVSIDVRKNLLTAQDKSWMVRELNHAPELAFDNLLGLMRNVNDNSLNPGELIMWAMDVDVSQPHEVVMVAGAEGALAADLRKKRAIGVCGLVEYDDGSGYRSRWGVLRPETLAGSYLWNYEGVDGLFAEGSFTKKLVGKPKHGVLSDDMEVYRPNINYEGKDVFVIEVSTKNLKVRVHYHVLVSQYEPRAANAGRNCGQLGYWKISQSPEVAAPNHLTTWQTQSHLSALLAAASGVHTELADLPGAALGLHEGGSGWNARITLDSNAAGHGWYVDATPWSVSDDYLPTSDPNLWLAKPGSGAEGKMDLLSVWLHELGHAAGLDHTASGAGLMGATLLPGQRRLPTQPELLQMFSHLQASGLVQPEAQAEHSAALAWLAGSGTGTAPGEPTGPSGPLRVPTGLPAALAGRSVRREGAFLGDFASAANPQLSNPGFEGDQG